MFIYSELLIQTVLTQICLSMEFPRLWVSCFCCLTDHDQAIYQLCSSQRNIIHFSVFIYVNWIQYTALKDYLLSYLFAAFVCPFIRFYTHTTINKCSIFHEFTLESFMSSMLYNSSANIFSMKIYRIKEGLKFYSRLRKNGSWDRKHKFK